MVPLRNETSGAQCFIIALDLFLDIVTDYYLEHPRASAFLNLRGIVSSYRVSITRR